MTYPLLRIAPHSGLLAVILLGIGACSPAGAPIIDTPVADLADDPSDDQVLGEPAPVPLALPKSQPTDLDVIHAQQDLIELAWLDHAADETGFAIERYNEVEGWIEIAQVGPNITLYTDTTVIADTGYCYRVRAFNNQIVGNASAQVCTLAGDPIDAPPADDLPPGSGTADAGSPPDGRATALVAEAIASTQIQLTWTESASNEAGFIILRYTGSTGWQDYDTVPADTTEYLDTAATPDVGHCYRVQAFNAAGESPATTPKCARPPAGLVDPDAGTTDPPAATTSCDGVPWILCPSAQPRKAFPTAEGFGAGAKGGRGGRVLYVTRLDDYNPDLHESPISGTLRWAVEEFAEPRNVLFQVGGTIILKTPLRIRERNAGYLTIAGQTAPGDGIQVAGRGVYIGHGARDVIIRYLRVRPGITASDIWVDPDGAGPLPPYLDKWDTDALLIAGTAAEASRNVIIDHCSLAWAPDEVCNIWGGTENITLQYCIIAEGLTFGHYGHPSLYPYDHNMAMLAGGENGIPSDTYLTMHHNLIINTATRNPYFNQNGGLVDFVNNVVFNWYSYATILSRCAAEDGTPLSSPRANFTSNHFIQGPQTISTWRAPISVHACDPATPDCNADYDLDDASIYVRDNLGPQRSQATQDDWLIVFDGSQANGLPFAAHLLAKRRYTPWPTAGQAVLAQPANQLLNNLPDHVGASFPRRDSEDARLVDQLRRRQGSTGFGTRDSYRLHPVLAGGTAPADSDRDGMPDTWEIAQGLDPHNPLDGPRDPDLDGYTNLDEYLNDLVGEH